MKKSLLYAALTAASVVALNAPAVVGAAPGINSNGVEGESEATFKVNPGDGFGNKGTLELVAVPNLNFGETSLANIMAGVDMSLTAATRVHVGTDVSDTAPYDISKAPGHILVKDYRPGTSTGIGWKLKASLSEFVNTTDDQIKVAGSINFNLIDAVGTEALNGSIQNKENGMSLNGSNDEGTNATVNTSDYSTSSVILRAAANTGRGTTGADVTQSSKFTPTKNANTTEGDYKATILWTLDNTPA